MQSKSILNNTAKILLPLLLGGAILSWMYRDFDFKALHDVLWHQMD